MLGMSHLFRHLSPHELSGEEIAQSQDIQRKGTQEGKLPANVVKVHILGDIGAGKTSLRKNLMGEDFNPHENKMGIGIHESTIDDNWRSVRSGLVDFKTSLLWYTAQILAEKRRELKESTANLIVDWRLILFHLLTFSLTSILGILYFIVPADQNKVAIICFLCTVFLRPFVDNISAYRLGGGFTLIVTFLDLILFYGEDDFLAGTTQGDFIKYVAFLLNTFIVGFILGLLMGAGFRTGLVIAFSSMLAPVKHVKSGIIEISDEVIVSVLGCFVGGLMFVATKNMLKSHPKRQKTKFSLLCFVFAVFVEHFSGFEKIRYFLRIFFAGYVVSCTILSGLPAGRRLNVYLFDAGKLRYLILTVSVGCVLAYLCGWKLPLHLNLPSAAGLTIFLIMCFLEVYRKMFYNRPADVDELTSMVVKFEALKQQSLPIVIKLLDFAQTDDQLYYNTHQASMAPSGIFLLVFDLRKFDDDEKMALKRLIFWLHSVSTYANNLRSPIFLVGTHMKNVGSQKCKQIAADLNKMLYENNSIYCDRLVINGIDDTPLFTVENSTRNDDNLRILQQAIIEKVKQLMEGDNFPIRWRKFYDHLFGEDAKYGDLVSFISHFCSRRKKDESFKKSRKIIRYEEAFQIAHSSNAVKNKEEMSDMLNYFHQAGYLIYLPKDPILKQYVVLNPQLIIQSMRSIVRIPSPGKRDESKASLWNKLEQYGVLHYDILKQIIDGLDVEAPFSVMEALLKAFDFICPIGRIILPTHGFRQVEWYLVPSKTQVHPKTPRTNLVDSQRIFYFDFGFFKPDSIFMRLVCKCIHFDVNFKVFRNTASFTVDKDFRCNLYLEDHLPEQHLIKVVITSAGRANPFMFLGRLNNYVEAIRKREYPELDYVCGALCEYPSKEDELHQHLDIFPLVSHKMFIEFPFAKLGSTMTRFCNGKERNIRLKAERRRPSSKTLQEKEDVVEDKRSEDDQEGTNSTGPLDDKMYDFYIICSRLNDKWVNDNLVPALQSVSKEPMAIGINLYKQREMNATFIKSCRINAVVISKHSVDDERFNEDREIAYAHHTTNKIIHFILDQSERVREIQSDLSQTSKCFLANKKPFEMLMDYVREVTAELLDDHRTKSHCIDF